MSDTGSYDGPIGGHFPGKHDVEDTRSQEVKDLESIQSQDDHETEILRVDGQIIGHTHKSESLGIKVIRLRVFIEEYDPDDDTVKGRSVVGYNYTSYGYNDDVGSLSIDVRARRNIDRTILS